jgi:hypothetical protein
VQFVAKGLIIIFSVSAAAVSGRINIKERIRRVFGRGVNA